MGQSYFLCAKDVPNKVRRLFHPSMEMSETPSIRPSSGFFHPVNCFYLPLFHGVAFVRGQVVRRAELNAAQATGSLKLDICPLLVDLSDESIFGFERRSVAKTQLLHRVKMQSPCFLSPDSVLRLATQ